MFHCTCYRRIIGKEIPVCSQLILTNEAFTQYRPNLSDRFSDSGDCECVDLGRVSCGGGLRFGGWFTVG